MKGRRQVREFRFLVWRVTDFGQQKISKVRFLEEIRGGKKNRKIEIERLFAGGSKTWCEEGGERTIIK